MVTSDNAAAEHALRARIAAGRLPHDPWTRTIGRFGVGDVCPVCEREARPQDVTFELEWASKPALHARCYHAWRRVAAANGGSSTQSDAA